MGQSVKRYQPHQQNDATMAINWIQSRRLLSRKQIKESPHLDMYWCQHRRLALVASRKSATLK
jgi:hypothetical protein